MQCECSKFVLKIYISTEIIKPLNQSKAIHKINMITCFNILFFYLLTTKDAKSKSVSLIFNLLRYV
jgi:hypothetical protein